MLNGAPPPTAVSKDEEHLRYLLLGHNILAGITALFSCFPIIHIVVGLGMILGGDSFFKESSAWKCSMASLRLSPRMNRMA